MATKGRSRRDRGGDVDREIGKEILKSRMLSTQEVADLLNKSKGSVDAMCERKHLRYIKLGNERRFPPAWLEEDLLKMAVIGQD